MKTWAQVESSPDFLAASDAVKDEVRAFYKASISAQPEFQALPPQEQKGVLQTVDGDGDYPVKIAASLIVAAQKERLGRTILDPKADEALEAALKGSKSAEKYIDVPLKDRPREPFQDEIPGHLDKPLRSILAFIDDALPEYAAVKFWDLRRGESLDDKLRNVLALSSRQPPLPVDANAALDIRGMIHDYASLDLRLPMSLPDLRTWSPEAQEKALSEDPEAALKHGLPQNQWGPIDRSVLTNLVHILAGIKNGIPRAFRPDAVNPIMADIRRLSFEILARQFYAIPSQKSLPTDPDRVAETILASGALAPGVDQVADDFPSVFAIAAGLAQVPRAAVARYKTFLMEARTPMTTQVLLGAVRTGSMSFIKLSKLDEMLFQEAATASGARPEALAHLIRDALTATSKPLLAVLLARSEAFSRRDFDEKKSGVRKKVQEEAQRQLATPPPAAPAAADEDPAPPVQDEGVHARAVPEGVPLMDPESEMLPSRPSDIPDGDEPPNSEIETPQSETTSTPKDTDQATATSYLRAHPISTGDVKKFGLIREFSPFPEVLSKEGTTMQEAVQALIGQKLIPEGSDHNDLLDALENDQRGVSAPPPGAEAGDDLPPADPPASPSENNIPEKKSEEMSTSDPVEKTEKKDGEMSDKLSPNEVRVVEVDPHTLIFRKDEERLWNSRASETRKRFPEGTDLPTITAYESKKGLEIIDGHHRAVVAKERGETLKAAVVDEAVFRRMESSGLSHEQIVYDILTAAGETESASKISAQYPDMKTTEKA